LHPRPYNIICYHYQQAAEKIAKALIVYYKADESDVIKAGKYCKEIMNWAIEAINAPKK